jgi:hypothetical protein
MILYLIIIDGVTFPCKACKGLAKGLLNYGMLDCKFII